MFLLIAFLVFGVNICESHRNQYGPDPWDVHSKAQVTSTASNSEQAHYSDYFFKRLLNVILKNRPTEVEPDGSREISVAMKISAAHWRVLEDVIKYDKPLTAEMYRKSVGYLCDSIYKPSLKERVVQAWSEYVLSFYYFYKTEISLFFAAMSVAASLFFISKQVPIGRLLWIILFIVLYMYEVFISYKEYERLDYERFMQSFNNCGWWFWHVKCEAPPFDKYAIFKHMHPSKIIVRMLSHFVTEPMVLISTVLNDLAHEITRGLYPPFNSIAKGILIFIFNVVCIVLIIMLMSTYILNIPFNVSFLAGLIHFGTGSRETWFRRRSTSDRISGPNLEKLLQALHARSVPTLENEKIGKNIKVSSAREGRTTERTSIVKYRSHSAGRLQSNDSGVAG